MTDDHSRDHRHGNGWATAGNVLMGVGIALLIADLIWIGATT